MSWDAQLASLTESGHVHNGAIVGSDGSVWVASPGFDPNGMAWKDALAEGGDVTPLQMSGVLLSGEKYLFVRSTTDADGNPESVILMKGTGGCVIVRSKSAFVVAQFNEGTAQNALIEATRLRDYLSENGF